MIDVTNIFRAKACTAKTFLRTNGQGCYLPAYQRPYSWDKGNLDRLLEDVCHGVEQLIKRPDTISFIGTVVAVHDTEYKTVKPCNREEVADRVMTIIDGQQRLSSLLLINIVLHNEISVLRSKIQKHKGKHYDWITQQAKKEISELFDSFVLNKNYGEGEFQYYPRIIRSYVDVWSTIEAEARYRSPIASITWDYLKFVLAKKDTNFTYNPKDEDGKASEYHKSIVTNFSHLKRLINRIKSFESEDHAIPDATWLVSDKFANALWGVALKEEVRTFVNEPDEGKEYKAYIQLLSLLVVTKYINERLAFTVVITTSEDDAFDMFEALNTTGEPLTAFETFVPKVIDAETLENYQTSPSKVSMDLIESYLERFTKAEQKQSATSELFVPFALTENGEKIQKKLNDQRRYLRKEYENLEDIEGKRGFVKRMAGVSEFIRYGWEFNQDIEKKSLLYPLSTIDEQALVGFEALKGIKHHIVIAPLSRFYFRAISTIDDENKRKARSSDFVNAIKATVAFSMLWRGLFVSTANIDNHYRYIMDRGFDGLVPPLSERSPGKAGVISLQNYKKVLRHILKEKGCVQSKNDWVKQAALNPIYDAKGVARFLLFCASHNTVPDPDELGLVKAGKGKSNEMLELKIWNDQDYYTIEHIVPQNNNGKWNSELYDERRTVHRLGNLILLPEIENSLVGNADWDFKRELYSAFCASDKDEVERIVEKLKGRGINLSNRAKEILKKGNHLKLCESVISLPKGKDVWSVDFIEKRSIRLAQLAWEQLYGWLM